LCVRSCWKQQTVQQRLHSFSTEEKSDADSITFVQIECCTCFTDVIIDYSITSCCIRKWKPRLEGAVLFSQLIQGAAQKRAIVRTFFQNVWGGGEAALCVCHSI
jgi:hypothetical protein